MDVSLQNNNNFIHKCMFNSFIVNRNNLINNVKQVKLKNLNSKICAMVKANAYGVGDIDVVKILDKYVDFFGVACFFEANRISKYTNKKILIVGPLEKQNIKSSFSYTCSSLEDIKYLKNLNKKINIHLKVNSGMNRYGFKNIDNFKLALKEIKSSKLNLEGLFTHFATEDDYVDIQMKLFNKFIAIVKEFEFNVIVHADNSIVNIKKNHNLDMVRVGFSLYNSNNFEFKSVVEIKSRIVGVNYVKKDELVGYNRNYVANKFRKVAIIPVGYADGFSVKNIGLYLYVNNKKCKVLNVCMDCFMLDITNSNVKKGTDIFVLNNINSLTRYAKHLQISEYEVMCNFSTIRANKLISSH